MAATTDPTLRLGMTRDLFKMPHLAPITPAQLAANAREVEAHLNRIPVVTTQTVHWNIPALPGDDTTTALPATFLLEPGTHKLHLISSFLSSGSDITSASVALDPEPTVVAVGGAGFVFVPTTSTLWTADITGLVSVTVATTFTVAPHGTTTVGSDTFVAQGAVIVDPVDAST